MTQEEIDVQAYSKLMQAKGVTNIHTVRWLSGPDNIPYQSNEVIQFSGGGDSLGISRCSNLWVVAEGTNQSVSVAETVAADSIVDLGRGLNLVTVGQFGALTAYDFQLDKGSHLTLLHFQQDVAAPDGHGGTMVSVFAGGPVACGKIDFVGDTHVKVVHT